MAAKKKAAKKVPSVKHRSRKGFSKLDEITVRGIDDTAKKLAEVYVLVGPLYRRVLREVEEVETERRGKQTWLISRL